MHDKSVHFLSVERSPMTIERLNTQLYKKMFAEQEKYREWLLSQPSSEVLNHCYEYTTREDILLGLEYTELDERQVKALLDKGVTLDDLFHDFEKKESDHMQDIISTIEACAGRSLRGNERCSR